MKNVKLKPFPVFLVIVMLTFTSIKSSSQEISSQPAGKSFAVYPTFGIGIGFFYPQDVNDYISEEIISQYGTSQSYNTEIYAYFEVKGGVTFRLKNVDFNALLEYDIAPKYVIVTNGESFSYGYNRVSPEISANYYIPGKSGKNAFFIGGGINYNFLSFKECSGSAPGFKVQLGYSMQFGKFNMQPYGAFRYVKASDSSVDVWGYYPDQRTDLDLDYTGGQIGLVFSFHDRMLYK